MRRECARGEVGDRLCDAVEWRDNLNGAAKRGLAGHSVDDATLFVLPDGDGTGSAHGKKPGRAVVAHASHDDAERARACVLRATFEEHLDRRLMAEHPWTVGDADEPPIRARRAIAHESHMAISWRQQRASCDQRVAVLRFLDSDLA